MVFGVALVLHFVAVLFFAGFILLDRVLFRKYFAGNETSANNFYKMSRKIMVLSAVLLILSGGVMLAIKPALLEAPLFLLKLCLAFMVMGLFFYCPYFSKRAGERARTLYRHTVTAGLLALLVIAKLFI